MRKKKQESEEDSDLRISGVDFGNIYLPDLDLSLFDVLNDEYNEETRYIKPKVYEVKPEYVLYDNAVKLAKDLRLDFGARYDVFVSGSFIFGDFLEAFIMGYNAKCKKMTISTLSLNQNNVDSLYNLLAGNYIDELNLIVSVYFWGNEIRSLIPYMYRKLDFGNKFQLSVASIHTKTAQFETLGGRKVVIHGSANLRSSGNIEQFTIEEHLPKKAKAKFGDIYALGKHRLICGDSTDAETVSLLVGDSKVDLLLTDPPYNVDYSSKNEALNAADKGNRIQKDIANDKMGDAQFQEFLTAAFTNANHHLKQGGAFYIWHAGTEGLNFKIAVKRVGWDLKQILIWNKNNMVLGRQDYQWKHEPCLYGWKPGAGHYFIARRDLLTVYEEKDIDIDALTKAEMKDLLKKFLQGSIPTTVIDEDKPLRSEDHPTMKPLKLMGRLIRNSTRPGEVVLDLFGGSGSTLMAAEQLGRVCYTVELDPCYIDVIIKRWEEYTGEKAKYLGNCSKEGNTEQKE